MPPITTKIAVRIIARAGKFLGDDMAVRKSSFATVLRSQRTGRGAEPVRFRQVDSGNLGVYDIAVHAYQKSTENTGVGFTTVNLQS